jgi:dolichyl-phosphate-mannose--protein O-mannosyl transferase
MGRPSNQVIRLLAATYRWYRDADDSLPEWSRKAAEIHNIKPRDWAYSRDELRLWWHTIEQKNGKRREFVVKTLGTIKRMWWLTALFTRARKGSIEALQWAICRSG